MSVVGEALAIAVERLGDRGIAVLARLGGPIGHAARDAMKQLAKADAGTRKRRRAEILTRARAPLPEGFRRVHASWIEHALATLPARARTAVASMPGDAVDVWLARWTTATLPPLSTSDSRSATELLDWLARAGADQLAYALGAEQISRLVRAAATPHAGQLAQAANRITKPPRVGQLGPQRAAIARCRDVSLDDELALIRIASRALAPHLAADQLGLRQLTRRLPRAIGIVIEREVAAHAATSFDQCPSSAAIDGV